MKKLICIVIILASLLLVSCVSAEPVDTSKSYIVTPVTLNPTETATTATAGTVATVATETTPVPTQASTVTTTEQLSDVPVIS